jgi:aminopeptidase N
MQLIMYRSLIFIILIFSNTTYLEADSYNRLCSYLRNIQNALEHVNRNTSENIDVTYYGIHLKADNLSAKFEGYTEINLTTKASTQKMILDLSDLITVDSVKFDGNNLSFTHENETLEIDLGIEIEASRNIRLLIYYGGKGRADGWSGIFNETSESWGNRITYTLSEPFEARSWFPCKQVLTDKADSAGVFITTTKNLKVGGNGLLTVVDVDEDHHRFEWRTKYPIAYYLIAFSIGEYVEYNTEVSFKDGDKMPIQNLVYDHPDCLPYYQDQLDAMAQQVELFSELFGKYPYHEEKYGHMMAPFGGGMEHQTMSTMGLFTFELNAHELAHQWFGNQVTCGTWQDIWINEGFARYSEFIAIEYLKSPSEAKSKMKAWHENIFSRSNNESVFIPEASSTDVSRIFDLSITYNKGAAILHMIRYIIDDDVLFFDVLKGFLQQYQNSTATGDDFRDYLNQNTDIDFTEFFNDWYYGDGAPKYRARWNQIEDSVYIEFNQEPLSDLVDYFELPVEIRLFGEIEKTIRVAPAKHDTLISLHFDHELDYIAIDPDNWILNKEIKPKRDRTIGTKVLNLGASIFDIAVYPNPVGNTINLKGDIGKKNFALFDLQGRIMEINPECNRKQCLIEVVDLSSGIYILKVDDGLRSEQIKVVVE